MEKNKRWSCGVLLLALLTMILGGGITAIIDPFFHYHAPFSFLAYPMTDQRYQNDGIVKRFTYDAVITGTSMTENFLTSELDALFGVHSIKVPFSGGTFREVDRNLQTAIAHNDDIKLVVRALDGYMLAENKDSMRTDAEYPDYLYDDRILNDVSYILNKEVLLVHTMKVLQRTIGGEQTTTFDEYSYWGDDYEQNIARVMGEYDWNGKPQPQQPLDSDIKNRVIENVRQNVIATAEANPDIKFYYFFPPYSIRWWFEGYKNGDLEKQMDIFRTATEEILKCKNIYLYSFVGEFDYIEKLENYRDFEHYDAQMNSQILHDMTEGVNLLTDENWQEHWDMVQSYYTEFPYAEHFESYGYSLSE